jgi:geranylgeranyl pyrophosphate synthase
MTVPLIDCLDTARLAGHDANPPFVPSFSPSHVIYPEWFTEGRIHFEQHFKRLVRDVAGRSELGALVPEAVNPGRRIRPALYCALWKAAHGDFPEESDLLPALALELFHAASIVLDDIADREEARRDKQPLFKIYDADTAILISHLLVAEGGRLFASHPNCHNLLEIWTDSYLAAVEGQTFSIRRFEGLTVEEHYRLSLPKTSSFFTFIAEALQTCAGLRVPNLTNSLRQVGESFQISNDIVDLLFLNESHRHNPEQSYPLRPSWVIIKLIEAGLVDKRELFALLPFSRHRELSEAAKVLIPDAEVYLRDVFRPVQGRLQQKPLLPGHKFILSEFLDCTTSPSFWLHSHV